MRNNDTWVNDIQNTYRIIETQNLYPIRLPERETP